MKPREKHVTADSNYYNYTSSVNACQTLLYLKCTGDFQYEPGYDLYRSSFDSYLLEILLEGSAILETQGKRFKAEAGQVVLLDCYKPHRYYTRTGFRALWVHFDGVNAAGYCAWIHRVNGVVFRPRDPDKIRRSLNRIYAMFHKHGSPDEPHIALELTAALTALMEPCGGTDGSGHIAHPMDEVLCYINENLEKEITVSEMAKIANFSEYHFIRRFREAVGMTPRKYLIAVRMEHAKYLLKTTALPVQEIGYTCGYASNSMFCTAFQKMIGLTPSQYRRGDSP